MQSVSPYRRSAHRLLEPRLHKYVVRVLTGWNTHLATVSGRPLSKLATAAEETVAAGLLVKSGSRNHGPVQRAGAAFPDARPWRRQRPVLILPCGRRRLPDPSTRQQQLLLAGGRTARVARRSSTRSATRRTASSPTPTTPTSPAWSARSTTCSTRWRTCARTGRPRRSNRRVCSAFWTPPSPRPPAESGARRRRATSW